MSFEVYFKSTDPDTPLYLHVYTVGNGYAFTEVAFQTILDLTRRFPKRGSREGQVFAVARYMSSTDTEHVLVFGWDNGRGDGYWTPFLKMPIKEADSLALTDLHERVARESLGHEFPRQVAIGCGP